MKNSPQYTNFMKLAVAVEKIRRVDPSDSLSASTVIIFLYIVQYPDRTIKEIEKLAEMSKSSTSRHILNLTERGDRARGRPGLGLVATYEDSQDSRVKRAKLTQNGERLKAEIAKILNA